MLSQFLNVSLFHQLTAVTLLAAVAGVVAHKLRQPLILAFIFVGLLVGPDALGIVGGSNVAALETLSELGIALLLFMVGLKLDPKLIKMLGTSAVVTGVLQVAVTTVVGALVCGLLGFDVRESLFLGLALSFSSTIIVVKLLTDKRSLDSLYGRMALGILIMQDIIVILAAVVFSAMNGASGAHAGSLWMIGVKFVLLFVATWGFVRFLSHSLSRLLSHSAELMVVFAMGFAGISAALCSYIGHSKELGGLLAGVALAGTSLNHVLSARLTGLRDFLLLFFFLALGAHMNMQGIKEQAVALSVLSFFVLLLKPVIIYIIMLCKRYTPRTGFMTGVSLGQISEFSLILAAMGITTGYLRPESADLVTALALVTISLSTGMITNGNALYSLWEKLQVRLGRAPSGSSAAQEVDMPAAGQGADIILVGLGKYGLALGHEFKKRGFQIMGVDFDPEAVKTASDAGWQTLYGDASDPEFPKCLPLDQAKAVVFTFHHTMASPMMEDLRRMLADNLRAIGYKGHIASTSHHSEYDRDLPRHGVDVLLRPFDDAAFHAAEKIQDIIVREQL